MNYQNQRPIKNVYLLVYVCLILMLKLEWYILAGKKHKEVDLHLLKVEHPILLVLAKLAYIQQLDCDSAVSHPDSALQRYRTGCSGDVSTVRCCSADVSSAG